MQSFKETPKNSASYPALMKALPQYKIHKRKGGGK